MNRNRKILGIDLGTTNSCVALVEGNKKIQVLVNEEGQRTTPSFVSFNANKTTDIGNVSKRQAYTNATNTIFAFKRLIGRKYSEVTKIIDKLPYKVVADKNGNAAVNIDGRIVSPIEISAILLGKLVESVSSYTNQPVEGTEVIITVPAHFDNSQREATKNAGEIAGLKVVRIINEPTAAAVAYGLESNDKGKNILVYDLGGGTFDITVLEISDGLLEVITTAGNSQLGGEDFDELLVQYIIKEFKKKNPNTHIEKDQAALYRIREEAKKVKERLSTCEMTNASVSYIAPGPVNLDIPVTRQIFENLIEKHIQETVDTVIKTCKDAKLSTDQIDSVVLVGGSTRIPLVKNKLTKIFGESKIKKDINPDEVIAQGAAIQGGIISGDFKDIVLIDITSLTLGIESLGGLMAPIIEKGSSIPTQKSKIFTTAADNQTHANIKICQGERAEIKNCRILGEFILKDIEHAPKGTPQIEVTFDIDANSILKVTAVDKKTNKPQSISLNPEVGITPEEKEKMIKEAAEQREFDEKQKTNILSKHELSSAIYTLEQQITKNKDIINQELKEQCDKLINDTKDLIKQEADVLEAEEYKKHIQEAHKIIKEIQDLAAKNQNSSSNNENNDASTQNPTPESTEEDTESTK